MLTKIEGVDGGGVRNPEKAKEEAQDIQQKPKKALQSKNTMGDRELEGKFYKISHKLLTAQRNKCGGQLGDQSRK